MRIDAEHYFCEAQAFTIDAISENVLDLSVARVLGMGRRLSVFIHVDVTATTNDNDETYEWQVRTDGDEAFGSATTLGAFAIARAALLEDTLHEIPIPQLWEFERYMALYFNGGGTTPVVTITAWLGESGSLPSLVQYPNAVP